MSKFTIAIDAGHFPNDVNGGKQGYKEGVYMMKLAKMLVSELQKYPEIKPVLTRTDADDKNPNNNVSLIERSRRAAAAGAFALYSLHSNAGGGTGTEVFYSLKMPGDKPHAADLSAGIAAALGIKNRGAKTRAYPNTSSTDYYSVIRETLKLGVKHAFLIEHAFHDNAQEERLLLQSSNLKAIAKVEAQTIARWLGVSAQAQPEQKTAIAGKAVATAAQMRAYLLSKNKNAGSYAEYAEIYLKEGEKEGIRGDIAFAQSLLETGNFKFGGDVQPQQNNFAGIGATGNGAPGNSFATPTIGIRAQIQHLKAYANSEPLKGDCVDPRFKYVQRGSATYVEWLGIPDNPNGKGWAGAKGYGDKVLNIFDEILKTKPAAELDNTPASWAAASIEKAINKDILIGDKNGNYKLHSPLTREEFFVFLDRAGLL